MTDRYTPAVGDPIRHLMWPDGVTADVLAVAEPHMWIKRTDEERPTTYMRESDWIKVERPIPIPHRYIGLWGDGTPANGVWASMTDLCSPTVLHIWTDEDGVDRIERVKP